MTPPALRALFTGLVDYAGLFPPATLSMEAAAREYALRLGGEDAWILGRFVVPARRLKELAECRRTVPGGGTGAWPVSVLVGADPASCPNPVPEGLQLESLELKPSDRDQLVDLISAITEEVEAYVEVPWGVDPEPWLEAIGEAGARGKIRCGGVTQDAIPSVEAVARALLAASSVGVPLKATAGLHHPLRGEYRLTYDDDPPMGTMHGFLNVFLAAALVRLDPSVRIAEVKRLLAERSIAAFAAGASGIRWEDRVFSTEHLAQVRKFGAVSYGSCSFAEPVDEMRDHGWLL